MTISRGERAVRNLEPGKPVDFRGFAAMAAPGQACYRVEFCRLEIACLKRRCARYRILAGRLRLAACITKTEGGSILFRARAQPGTTEVQAQPGSKTLRPEPLFRRAGVSILFRTRAQPGTTEVQAQPGGQWAEPRTEDL